LLRPYVPVKMERRGLVVVVVVVVAVVVVIAVRVPTWHVLSVCLSVYFSVSAIHTLSLYNFLSNSDTGNLQIKKRRKEHNEELHNLYPSPDIIRVIKLSRISCKGHI